MLFLRPKHQQITHVNLLVVHVVITVQNQMVAHETDSLCHTVCLKLSRIHASAVSQKTKFQNRLIFLEHSRKAQPTFSSEAPNLYNTFLNSKPTPPHEKDPHIWNSSIA